LTALEAASVAGDGDAIAEHSRQHDRLQAGIEAAFEELETANTDYEDAAGEFDQRLDELAGDG
jgi:hypothetical protein